MRQRTFFDAEIEADNQAKRIPVRDPNVAADDEPRLTGQNLQILQRLKCGPCLNVELAQISLKYTSRVSDLRAAGYEIECQRLDGGKTLYKLKGFTKSC